MGAWGIEAYENDTALDWAGETGADLKSIEEALVIVIKSKGEELDADEGCIAVAACQALLDYHNPKQGLLDKILGKKKSVIVETELIAKANEAIPIIIGENSELSELWAEGDEHEDWIKSVEGIQKKLNELK